MSDRSMIFVLLTTARVIRMTTRPPSAQIRPAMKRVAMWLSISRAIIACGELTHPPKSSQTLPTG